MKQNLKQLSLRHQLILSICATAIAVIFTILVANFNLKPIGPQASSVGFADFNQQVASIFPYNKFWHQLTSLALGFPILVAGIYAIFGLSQLIKYKKFSKISPQLYLLAGFYFATILVYIIFEKLALNFRPVILKDGLEASYPSTHALLAVCFCGSAILVNRFFIKSRSKLRYINLLLVLSIIFIVVGRVLAGVHWATDIIGGLIIAAALLSIFQTILLYSRQTK